VILFPPSAAKTLCPICRQPLAIARGQMPSLRTVACVNPACHNHQLLQEASLYTMRHPTMR
jgi:hypothetical protein